MAVKLMTRTYNHMRMGQAVVAGAAADTDIAVAGITTKDELVFVWESATSTAIITDQTANASITEDGVIQISVTTSSDTLLVLWASAS